jgi:hypothetical protein
MTRDDARVDAEFEEADVPAEPDELPSASRWILVVASVARREADE